MIPCSPVVYFILSCSTAVIRAEQTFSSSKLLSTVEEPASDHSHPSFKKNDPPGLAGFEPGDPASEFRVRTLTGEFVYPLRENNKSSVIIHAFTNKSAFLECLWTSNSSLSDLLELLPVRTELLFLSLDDAAAQQAVWMREQVYRAATHRNKEILSRLHFSPIPVYALGNWIPRVLYSWGCGGHNCGLAQVVFTSPAWNVPVIAKRLNARYDWLNGRWEKKDYILVGAGNGCEPIPAVAGAVAWVSENGCSFFTKIKTMAESKAVGVLVYAVPGNPIQDMNCVAEECNTTLNIPASMLHFEPDVMQALIAGKPVNVSFQLTPSPNFFIAIDQQGALAEMGWFLYPTFRFISWQAQWFNFHEDLLERVNAPATVVPVLDNVKMQGEAGAQAVVEIPSGTLCTKYTTQPELFMYDVLEVDAALSCPGSRDESCAHWDHTVQLFICCDLSSSYCNQELGRWITAFRRGTGRWLTDVSPLLPLLNGKRCALTMKTVPWAMPWIASLNLRFSHSNQSGNFSDRLYPFTLTSLYNGGTFDKDYNTRYHEIKFIIPASTKKVELYAVITGHGSDDNNCGEFCVTSHFFLINGIHNNSLTFDSAGSALGCTEHVDKGAVPNEHGTWLYGRGGWCDGLQVDPWRVDITPQLDMEGPNTILYFGLFEGRNPSPTRDPGYIIMYSYLVFYK